MKKISLLLCGTIVFAAILSGCGASRKNSETKSTSQNSAAQTTIVNNALQVNKPKDIKVETTQEAKMKIDSIYKGLYIGEIFKSGFAYIEPFNIDRKTDGQPVKIVDYPKETKIYPLIKNANTCYAASFNDKFSTYVPNSEKDSTYFLQPFSSPKQSGLRYKLSNSPEVTGLAIAFFNQEIINSDLSVSGTKRPYSKIEYSNALNEVEKDKKASESERTLSNIKLDETIIGAQEICVYSIKDSSIKILVSKYNTHGIEYAANVYVVDFIIDGKVIQTYEKHNWDGPY